MGSYLEERLHFSEEIFAALCKVPTGGIFAPYLPKLLTEGKLLLRKKKSTMSPENRRQCSGLDCVPH